jgi:hypothetical protein
MRVAVAMTMQRARTSSRIHSKFCDTQTCLRRSLKRAGGTDINVGLAPPISEF